jgi:hypothetical protein
VFGREMHALWRETRATGAILPVKQFTPPLTSQLRGFSTLSRGVQRGRARSLSRLSFRDRAGRRFCSHCGVQLTGTT